MMVIAWSSPSSKHPSWLLRENGWGHSFPWTPGTAVPPRCAPWPPSRTGLHLCWHQAPLCPQFPHSPAPALHGGQQRPSTGSFLLTPLEYSGTKCPSSFCQLPRGQISSKFTPATSLPTWATTLPCGQDLDLRPLCVYWEMGATSRVLCRL